MRKGFLMLANAMEIERWDPGSLRRLKFMCVVAGCDFYNMGLEEGKRNYAGIADVVFTADPDIIAAKDSLPFSVVEDTWFPARALPAEFLNNQLKRMEDRLYDVGIFKRAGWEKNWDFLLDNPDPFKGRKVYVHCPWHEHWYNEREKAIYYKVVRVCRERGYHVDTRVIKYHDMVHLYDNCRTAILFSKTESDSRMMVEAYFRGCNLFIWTGTDHLIPNLVASSASHFMQFEQIPLDRFDQPNPYHTSRNPRAFWSINSSADTLQEYYEKHYYPPGLGRSNFRQLDAHSVFHHVCREGEEIKMMRAIGEETVTHED